MKKRNKIILVILTCVICFVTICTLLLVNKKPKLNENLKNEIINVYKEKNNIKEDIKIEYYFGKYNNYHVLYIEKNVDTFIDRYIKISDYTFDYSVNKALEVYKDGEFYTLGNLYKEKLINDKHIKKIYNQTEAFFDKVLYSYNDFLKNKGLSLEVYNKIISIHQKDRIVDYYGEYNGLHVVSLASLKTDKDYVYTMDIMWDQYKYDMIRAIDNEKMYTLEETYNSKKLSMDQIVEIFQVVYGYVPYVIVGQSGEEMSKHASYALVQKYYNEFYSKEDSSLELFDLWEKYNRNVYCYLYNNLRVVWLYTEGESNGESYTINVGGYDFVLDNNQTILVYFGQQHYTLGRAYDEGLISENDMEIVYLSSASK